MKWFRAYYLGTSPTAAIPKRMIGMSVYVKKTGDPAVYTVFDGCDTVLVHSEDEAKALLRSYRTSDGKVSVLNIDEHLLVEEAYLRTKRNGKPSESQQTGASI